MEADHRGCRWGWAVAFIVLFAGACQGKVDRPLPAQPNTSEQTNSQRQPAASDRQVAEDHQPRSPQASEKPRHTNALAAETSPYLLMHAHNPVDWHPWNESTLAKAKAEGKPIFLSVGYSSCHWCHVMERETFLDEEIASFLNENFICIKVDREERPDVDEIYMESLLVFNRLVGSGRGGGWPLTVFLTPDAHPFFGGTYFPARDGDRPGAPGFLSLIKIIDQSWREQPQDVVRNADVITRLTRLQLQDRGGQRPTAIQSRWWNDALDGLNKTFDDRFGGFGFSETNARIPKFPDVAKLLLLCDFAAREQSPRGLADSGTQSDSTAANPGAGNSSQRSAGQMLITTCQRMLMGGIYDHVGGGFHRYSVDRFWQIPHFEKMLYDNGQLATVYAQAYQLTGNERFRDTAEGILDFVVRELSAPGGAFYSSLDAESEGVEGRFYRWEKAELRDALTANEYDLFANVYGVDQDANFENEFYVPQLRRPLQVVAKEIDLPLDELQRKLKPIRQKLLKLRQRRVRPLTDTKILTEWNGLMIRGFADAGRIFKQPRYTQTAVQAANFILENLRQDDGRLFRTHTDGIPKLDAYLSDYTSLISGLLALHRSTGDQKWFEAAVELQTKQDQLFEDQTHGGYFYTSENHTTLLVRTKRAIDNAVPSGTSVAAENLYYFSLHADEGGLYREKAVATVLSAGNLLDELPLAAPRLAVVARKLKSVTPKP